MSWGGQTFRYGSGKPYVPFAVQATKLLAFIIAYQRDHGGISPSFPEMAAGIGKSSKSQVHRAMARLIAERKIRTLPHRARAIEVIPQEIPDAAQDIPVRPKPLLDTSEGYLFYKVVKEEGYDVWLVPMERGKQ